MFGNNNGVIDTDPERAQVLKAAIAARATLDTDPEHIETYIAQVLVTDHSTWSYASQEKLASAVHPQTITKATRRRNSAFLGTDDEFSPLLLEQLTMWSQKADACGNDNGVIDTDYEWGEVAGFAKKELPRGRYAHVDYEAVFFRTVIKASHERLPWFVYAARIPRR